MGDHVFICYSRKDKEFARILTNHLKSRGVSVWGDWDILASADWDRSIDAAIKDCAHFLIILSSVSVESREVKGELHRAFSMNKHIVPVLYQSCNIPRQLLIYQYIDFTSCSHDDVTALNKVLEALGIAADIRENREEDVSYWLDKGIDFHRYGKHEDSIEAYNKSIEQYPKYPDPWKHKGDALYSLRKHEEALQAYNRAIELYPKYVNAWYGKGIALHALGKHEEALKAHNRAIELQPRCVDAWCSKGHILRAQGKYDEAIKAFDKAIEIEPLCFEASLFKAKILDDQGKYDEVVKVYDKVIELNPQNEWAWNYKGKALKVLGRTTEADKAFAKAKELGYTG